MASAADRARANANAMRGKKKPAPEVPDEETTASPGPSTSTPPTARAAGVRIRKVRRTVDLSPNAHRDLGRWCDDLADVLGLSRVTSQDVLTALVDELLESGDGALAAAVRRRIERTRT